MKIKEQSNSCTATGEPSPKAARKNVLPTTSLARYLGHVALSYNSQSTRQQRRMASTKQIETALLTEHLRYTPLTLLDDVINTVNELSNRAVDGAEEGLLSADPARLGFKPSSEKDADGKPVYPEARPEIEEGAHKLETLLESNIDKNFDKLEIYTLRNVLTAPAELVPWIKLEHYEVRQTDNREESFLTVFVLEYLSPDRESRIIFSDTRVASTAAAEASRNKKTTQSFGDSCRS